jgi:hypothetical protein
VLGKCGIIARNAIFKQGSAHLFVSDELLSSLANYFYNPKETTRNIMTVARDNILKDIAIIGVGIALGVTNHLLSDINMVSYFGATPADVVHTIWVSLQQEPETFRIPRDGTELKHVLWALHFAKNYPKKKAIRKQYSVAYKTFLKYEFPICGAMGTLVKDIVSYFVFCFLIKQNY